MNPHQLEILRKNNEESHDFVKSCFRYALMIILKDDSNAKVTVSRLCKIAGVSRTAFYRNYHDVEDVLVDEIKGFGLALQGRIGRDVYKNWLALFELGHEHFEDLKAIVKSKYEYKILDVFMALLPQGEESHDLQSIWISLFYSFLLSWLRQDKPKKPEEMARLAYKYTKDIPLVVTD